MKCSDARIASIAIDENHDGRLENAEYINYAIASLKLYALRLAYSHKHTKPHDLIDNNMDPDKAFNQHTVPSEHTLQYYVNGIGNLEAGDALKVAQIARTLNHIVEETSGKEGELGDMITGLELYHESRAIGRRLRAAERLCHTTGR